ncbi:sterol esterase [Phlyctema vagabunda]|uniref:Sterol esterase n=1 Tax=Phlyctema vagabunda TaxID=108571 RepID=A0ABR4P5N7_9HELO
MGDNAPAQNDVAHSIPDGAVGDYEKQAAKLSLDNSGKESGGSAVRAEYITTQDPVIVTADGGRLPTIPLAEAQKLNTLKEEKEGHSDGTITDPGPHQGQDVEETEKIPTAEDQAAMEHSEDGTISTNKPPTSTDPLFPPLPLYGPPTFLRTLQSQLFRTSSFCFAISILSFITLASVFSQIPSSAKSIGLRLMLKDPNANRKFYKEEKRRQAVRKEENKAWKKKSSRKASKTKFDDNEGEAGQNDGFIPTEGGHDPLVVDVGYYARRVGLDSEEIKVQTEDGFILDLWHIYDPKEYTPMSETERAARGPEIFVNAPPSRPRQATNQKPKFPVLMIHGLLQSSGAYCATDDDSLAFYLCKSGYDVWLGNNRCGFKPKHTTLKPSDPRFWAWNVRQMGVIDLPALASRVLSETGFKKIGLVGHSQGTTQSMIALAQKHRPDLGGKLTIFCGLAPAAYAGSFLQRQNYFKSAALMPKRLFKSLFGIHAFIPVMVFAHKLIPGPLFGFFGYMVFGYLFDWSDSNWDRGLRDRCFIFAPVYVSAEHMRWWLGKGCFVDQRCILNTLEEQKVEEAEDAEDDHFSLPANRDPDDVKFQAYLSRCQERKPKTSGAWYNKQSPPMAFWVAAKDDLVDGARLLNRFRRGREPNARLLHFKTIDDYEHLDVIWAIDSIEQVGREVKDFLWQTCTERDKARVPKGCEDLAPWMDDRVYDENGTTDSKEAH